MKVVDLLRMQQSLTALANTKLPIKPAYRIAKALGQIEPVLKDLNVKQHELYKQFGDLNEDKTQYVVPETRKEEFNAAMAALTEEPVSLELLKTNISEFGSVLIEPVHIMALDGFVLVDDLNVAGDGVVGD